MPRCPSWVRPVMLLGMSCVTLAAGAADTNGPMASSPAASAAGSAAPDQAGLNVPGLFANTCGWCHSGAGRIAGKGPQLMGTKLTDSEIVYRIRTGKPGAMPAFGAAFTDDQMKAIVAYIRDLKPEGSAQ